ncbi:MAG TPA: helix-turn-helix domain-containing protein [Anaerolineales bacterium]|nr:helix-turn-helix domain-containing protein [Anaerolineales bacterium]
MNGRSFGRGGQKGRRPRGPRRAARRRTRDTRAAILEAAYRLFLHQGYHGTSMRQIAGHARLTPAAIYNHFRGKEAIFLALLAARMPQRVLVGALSAAEGETVEALVQDALARMNEAMANQYDNMRLLFIELLEFQGRHARHLAEEFLPLVLDFMGRLGSAQGGLRRLDPIIVARAFLGLLMSYAITVTFLPKVRGFAPRPSDLYNLGDIFLHGVLAAPSEARLSPPAGSGTGSLRPAR